MKLFFTVESPGAAEQERLLRSWYRVNIVRLVVISAAWLAAGKAGRTLAQ
jgi:hypothetical protein